MLKLNAFSKEKNVKFSLKEIDRRIPYLLKKIFISSLFIRMRKSRKSIKKLIIYR